jgi:phage terminase Nu1 subunit (DNA packaging protein)
MADFKVTDETTISTTELARVLGLSVRRIQQMAQDGTVPPAKKGRFRLNDSVQRYITFITGNQMTEDEQKMEKTRKSAEVQIKVAKAAVAKLEASELQGKMHRSEDVQAVTEDMASTLRSMLIALPGQLAVDCNNAESAAECAAIIKKGVHRIMNEMCKYKYDPDKYAERVRDRLNWDTMVIGDE